MKDSGMERIVLISPWALAGEDGCVVMVGLMRSRVDRAEREGEADLFLAEHNLTYSGSKGQGLGQANRK
jgi:hypothetical protein